MTDLWVAYNGFVGDGPVGVILEAPNEPAACAGAENAFRERIKTARHYTQAEKEDYCVVREVEQIELPWHFE